MKNCCGAVPSLFCCLDCSGIRCYLDFAEVVGTMQVPFDV